MPKLACVLQTMLIELMVHEISLSNRANLSHSELTEMHFTSYGMNEHKTCTDLCFEVKQVKFALEFPHIIRRTKSFAAPKIWLILLTFMKNGSREPSPNNRETWIIKVQLHKPNPNSNNLLMQNLGWMTNVITLVSGALNANCIDDFAKLLYCANGSCFQAQ